MICDYRGCHSWFLTHWGRLICVLSVCLLAEEGEDRITVSFVGMPNVGKSSLVNEIFGETRLITSELSGTTRDAVALDFEVLALQA